MSITEKRSTDRPSCHLPINLATLTSKPSWQNLADRVDRSACMELRASEVKGWAELKRCRTGRTASRRALERGKPQAKTNREAAGPATISAYEVFAFMQRRKPRKLSGDYRTVKANAMRIARDADGQPLPPRHPSQGMPNPKAGPDQALHANPNQGACRSKLLGLPAAGDWPTDLVVPRDTQTNLLVADDPSLSATTRRGSQPRIAFGVWEQTFIIERWRQHERLAQHFILCPTCGDKYVKLFLPLCTQEELRDALLAQQWLHMQTANLQLRRRSLQQTTDTAAFTCKLNDRYGMLFQPRGFQCRKCLGVRYGTGGRHNQA